MPRRRAVVGLVLAIASAVAAFLIRQRGAQRIEKLDLHFADGTMASLDPGSPAVDRVLDLGRAALAVARD